MMNYKSGDDPEPVVLRSWPAAFAWPNSLVHWFIFPIQMEIGIGIAHFQARQLIHFQTCVFVFMCWMEEIDQAAKKPKNPWRRDTYLH